MLEIFQRARHKMFPLHLSKALRIVSHVMSNDSGPATHYDTAVKTLIEVAGDKPIGDVTLEDVANWHRYIRTSDVRNKGANSPPEDGRAPPPPTIPGKKRSPWTVDNYTRNLKAFFNHLVRMGHLEESPARKVKLSRLPKKAKKEISTEDIERMVDASQYDLRNHAIVLILRDSGCRVGELVSMLTSELVLEEYVNEDGETRKRGKALIYGSKVNRHRWIFFGHEAALHLERYLRSRPHDAGYHVWLSRKGRFSTNGVYQMLKRVAKRAGVERFNPHSFRHAFGKRLANERVPLKGIADLMGHEDPITSTMYTTYDDNELQELHTRYLGD